MSCQWCTTWDLILIGGRPRDSYECTRSAVISETISRHNSCGQVFFKVCTRAEVAVVTFYKYKLYRSDFSKRKKFSFQIDWV